MLKEHLRDTKFKRFATFPHEHEIGSVNYLFEYQELVAQGMSESQITIGGKRWHVKNARTTGPLSAKFHHHW